MAARGRARSGHSPRPRSGEGSGAQAGVDFLQQVRPKAAGCFPPSSLRTTPEGCAHGPGRKSPQTSRAPQAHSVSSAAAGWMPPWLPGSARSGGWSALPDTPQPRPKSPRMVSYPRPGACCSLPAPTAPQLPPRVPLRSCRLCLRPPRFGLGSEAPRPPPRRRSPAATVALADLAGGRCEEPVNRQRPGAPLALRVSNLTGRNFGRDRTAGGCPVGFTF